MTLPDTDRPLKDGHQDGPFAEKPRDPVYRLLDLMARICMTVAGVQMVSLIAIFGWLVFGRYVLNDTPTWVEQAALVLVVWITFLGGAAGVWNKAHLSIDFVREMMPPRFRIPLRWIAGIGVLIVPQSLARLYHRKDLTYRPITDAPTCPVGLAFPEGQQSELVEEFIGIVRGRKASSSRGQSDSAPKRTAREKTLAKQAARAAAGKVARRPGRGRR